MTLGNRPNRFSGLEVGYKLVFGYLLDWEIGRLLALEDLIDVDRGVPIHIVEICAITHQPSFSFASQWRRSAAWTHRS
jgi:hypothetical protein